MHEWDRALRRSDARTASPGNDRGAAMAVALGAHASLANRCRPHSPLAGRVSVRSEHVDFGGSESPVSRVA